MSLSPEQYQKAAQAIVNAQNILVIPHANVDPDGLGSALACYDIFTKLGKNVTVICPDTKPDALSFLPGFEDLEEKIELNNDFVVTINLRDGMEIDKLRYSVEDNKVNIIVTPKEGNLHATQVALQDSDKPFDLLCIVDTADLHLLGSVYETKRALFDTTPILNIDHHSSNPRFGQTQLIDTNAASATEVLYKWFSSQPNWKEHISADTATLLLTGLITDTRSFQNPNTTPESLEVAAELLDLGARQQEIIQHIYKTKPLSTLKIWGRALNRIQVDASAGIVWSSVSKEDLAEMDASSKETHGILDELISTIPEADVYILFTEIESGGLKASARSSEHINISAIANKLYGGGGHDRAAGFKIPHYDNFQLVVVEAITKIKTAMQQQKVGNNASVQTAAPSHEETKATNQPIDIVSSLEKAGQDNSNQTN